MGKVLLAIVLGGMAAGALDIFYAFVVYGPLSYGLTPERVLQSVAAGWIGREAARDGGLETALLGLGSHFLIATVMAGVYVFASRAAGVLARRAVICGLVYGVLLYIAMNYIVVPLSAAATGAFASSAEEAAARLRESFSEIRGGDEDYPWLLWGTIGTHTLLVGLPIALIAKRFR